MGRGTVILAAAGLLISLSAEARSAALPTRVGQCGETRISKIGQRLEDGDTGKAIPNSGSAVSFANRGYQVSDDEVPAIQHSRRGDRVLVCLVKLPEDCPPGDNRGRFYTTTNLRTLEFLDLAGFRAQLRRRLSRPPPSPPPLGREWIRGWARTISQSGRYKALVTPPSCARPGRSHLGGPRRRCNLRPATRPRDPIMLPLHAVPHLLHRFGYWLVGGVIGLESMGVPLPGETMVIAAALFAGATHQLNIGLIVAAAAAGAIIGDNIGYLIGREIGYRVLARFGRRIGLDEHRLALGQFLFRRHGGKVVFFGRFVAILRTFAALLAGANHMHWKDFLRYNALGGIVWACLYGFGAYALGKAVTEVAKPLGIAFGVIAAVAIVAGAIFVRRNEARLAEQAERLMAEEAGKEPGARPGTREGPGAARP